MPRSGARNRSNSFAELAGQEERLRLTFLAAGFGTFDYDPGRDMLIWDDTCRACFGVPPGEPVDYHSSFVPALHPDDRDAILEQVCRITDTNAPFVPFERRYRTVGISDGVVRHILARGRRMRMSDDSERILGVVMQLPDETETKRFVVRGGGQDGPVVASRGRPASALVLARRWSEAGIRGVTVTEPGGRPLRLHAFRARFFPGKGDDTP